MAGPWDEFARPAAGAAREKNPWDEFAAPVVKPAPASESNTLWGDARAETVWGELGAGLQSGVRQVVSSAPAIAGLGAQVFEDVTGVSTRGLPQALLETSTSIAEGGAQRGVARVEDLEAWDPVNWTRYVAGTIGEAVPTIAAILSGAGGARILAQKMAAKGIPASTRASVLKTIPAEMVGAGLTAAAIETGGTAQELYGATKEVEPYASVAAGTAKGAMESVMPLMLGKAFGLTGGQANHLLDRLLLTTKSRAGRAAVGFGTEAATEYAQEEIDLATRAYMDENFSFLSPEAYSRRLNAAVAGGVGGGFFASLTPGQASQALDEKLVRDSLGDTPIVTGQDPNELPTLGPEAILRHAPAGLDATVGSATMQERDELLSESNYQLRGLVAPVIPNMEHTFGTQEQALNDATIYRGQGYLRLDPNKVRRGDISASVEDLPDTLNNPRVDFLDNNTITEASQALTEAIKLKTQASGARSGRVMEQKLIEAQAAYRKAMGLGARVEPYPDGQIVLRDPKKAAAMYEPLEQVQSQLSQAGLLETRKLSNGKNMYVFDKTAEEADSGPGGRKIDLEAINPNKITALPSYELVRRVRADDAVSRKHSLGRAKGLGIRFTPGVDATQQQALLKKLSKLLNSMTATVPFNQQPAAVVDEFMNLVDAGLRLDVQPGSPQFAVLDQLESRQLALSSDTIGPVSFGGQTKRIVKGRARKGGPRVAKVVQFYDKATQQAFTSQFHGNPIGQILRGTQTLGQEVKPSELLTMLREVVKPLGLRTDYVLEIVPPSVLPDQGVKHIEKEVIPPGGKNLQPRSVIMVNPWFYAKQTEGKKPLTRPISAWAVKNGPFYKLDTFGSKKSQARRVVWKEQEMTLGEALADAGLQSQDKRAVLRFDKFMPQGTRALPPVLEEFATREEFAKTHAQTIQEGRMASAEGVVMQELLDWLRGQRSDPPTITSDGKSVAGKAAAKIGAPDTKMFMQDEALTELYGDFTVAVAESIVAYEWASTESSVQEMITREYKREMHLQTGTQPETQMARTLPHPIVDRAVRNRKGAKHEAYSFEQWVVNQIARTMTGPVQPVGGPVAKFFNKTGAYISGVIQRLYDRARAGKGGGALARDPLHGMPQQVIQDWLTDIQLRQLDQSLPDSFLDKGSRDALITSINKNRDALKKQGIDEYVVATPERASTYQVRQLLKLLPNDPQYNPARAKLECLLATCDRHNTMMEWLLGIHQMADMNPHIEGLQVYKSGTRAMENSALSWATMADKRLREAQQLGKAQMEGLFKVIYELDRMTYLTKKERDEGVTRWPTPEELLQIVKTHKLNNDAYQVYVKIRQDFAQFISYMEEVSVRNAQETITDPEVLTNRVQEIRGQTEQIRRRPYFPHMRFGRFATTVRDKKGKVVHFEAFETQAQRGKASVDMAAKYPLKDGFSFSEDYLTDTLQQWQGLPRYALQSVIKQLGLDQEDLTPRQQKDKSLLESMAEASLPTESFRNNLINRKGVPGYSLDGMRAYATYFARAARFMARMEYSRTLENAIQDVRATASPISKDARTRIADFMTRHFQGQMESAADWAELRGLGFLWYFGFAPAAAFINLTQVPLVTMPFLAAKFGDVKTVGRVTQAYADSTKEFYSWLKGAEVVDSPLQEALEEAHFNRLIDDGFATELAAISQGPVLQATLPGNPVSRGFRRVAQWGTYPFAMAERINRSVSFRAAWKLAMANNDVAWIDEIMEANKTEVDQLRIDRGWSERHLRAYMAAAETVRKTQFEYGRWSRPQIMGGVKGVLFMFKTYLQNMLYFLFKSDRRTQVRHMLLLLATAGVMGLPGAEDATELAKWLARQFGLQFDFERAIRSQMVAWGADEVVDPDIVLHGASREGFGVPAAMSGLGLPSPRIDLSGSLSMGKIIPGLQKGLNPSASMFNDSVGDVVSEVAGPVFGVPFALYQSLVDRSIPADDPKRWEKVMPRGLKAVSRASRLLAEQRERDRSGATILSFDPNDVSDQMDILLGVGLGFQPTRLSQTWDYLTAQKEVQDYWKGQRQILMSEMYRAYRLKDQEGRRDALLAIRKFNEEAPDRSLRISGDSIRQSLRTREKGRVLKEQHVPREKALRGVASGVDKLYPEVVRREKVRQGKAP